MIEPPPSRPAIAHSLNWTTRRYRLALVALAVLAVTFFLAFHAVIAAHDRTLAVVNEAGRQRMLSQRIALYVERLAAAQCVVPRAECVATLAGVVEQFERAHQGLALGDAQMGLPGPTSDRVRALYEAGAPSLNDRVAAYVAASRAVLDAEAAGLGPLAPDHPAVRHIVIEGAGPLLGALDAAVAAYQADGEAAMERLRALQVAVLLLTLAVLALEAVFIFRPMVRRLGDQFAAIAAFSASLERRVAERTAALADATAEAERANRAKSRFLGAAGHDMLQPLQAAEMVAGMMGQEVTTERGRALLADLHRCQGSLRHLVRSVLEVSRLEAGDVRPVMQDVAVGPLLLSVAAELAPVAAARELRLAVVPSSLWVRSDPHLLARVVRNLLANALRYTAEGGVVLGCRRHGGDTVLIQVVDSGIGIAAEDQARIFEAFVQVGAEQRDRSEGLGLGLSVVQGLCALLGHGVAVASAPGRGSVFTLRCARVPVPAGGGVVTAVREARESSALPGSGSPPPVPAGHPTHEP